MTYLPKHFKFSLAHIRAYAPEHEDDGTYGRNDSRKRHLEFALRCIRNRREEE